MKKLIFILLLVGCGSEAQKKESLAIEDKWIEIELPHVTHRSGGSFNGEIEHRSDNSWTYTSHVNDNCKESIVGSKALKSPCRKALSSYVEEDKHEAVKVEFDFTLHDFNVNNPPDWVIVYQDWVRIIPEDSNGNHPITTIKIKSENKKIYLAHYDNSWQWGYDFGDDKWDANHNHQPDTLNARVEIELGVEYSVEVITYRSGSFVFRLNGSTISDKDYQTKSPTETHVIQWGEYWSKGYNTENDPLSRITLSINDFKLYQITGKP